MAYLQETKHILTQALKDTFDEEFPDEQFRGLHISIEYPGEAQNYPGVWVDFEPRGALENVGITHKEHSEPADDGTKTTFRRWRFQGMGLYTCVAMSSLERDKLHDEIINVWAFGTESPETSQFRVSIENNDFIAMNMDFDQIEYMGAMGASAGTPWGTDDVVYEVTLGLEVVGEFVSAGDAKGLYPLREIRFFPYADDQPDPTDAVAGDWR